MKVLRILIISGIFILISGLSYTVYSQNMQTALELSKGNKFKYIKPGRKATVWYEEEKYKVWVDSIGIDKIFTKNKIFKISQIDKIAVRYRGTMITGSILGTAGVIFTGLGTALIIKGLISNDLGGIFAVIIGISADIIGIPLTSVGSAVFFIGKKYKKDKGWKFKAVQIE